MEKQKLYRIYRCRSYRNRHFSTVWQCWTHAQLRNPSLHQPHISLTSRGQGKWCSLLRLQNFFTWQTTSF
jgi:hypothetical protein